MQNQNRRWYDNNNEANQTLMILKSLDRQSKRQLSTDLVEIIKQIKELHKEEDEPNLSIGIQRVLGLYQMNNSRRWYDKNSELTYALKTMFTLPDEDFLNIMEGLFVSLNN